MSKDKQNSEQSELLEEEEFEIELEELEQLDEEVEELEELEDIEEDWEDEILTEEDMIRRKTKELETKVSQASENFLRLHAEYDNYRKRTTKERSAIYPEATATAVSKFLPVLDNFDRAMEFKHDTKEFKEGFDLIYQNLKDVLKELNVEEVGERGEPFNPDFHHAVMHCEDPDLPPHTVSMVLQKGYKIGDRVIRHAMVQTAN